MCWASRSRSRPRLPWPSLLAKSRRGGQARWASARLKFSAFAIAAQLVWSTGLRAQVPVDPVVQLQPAFTTWDFASVPEGTQSATAFTLRFQTRFPTSNRWLQFVAGASFAPYGSTGITRRDTDAPTIFAGNIFTLVDARRGSGWVTVEVPLLVTHAPGASATSNPRDYGRDLVVQPTAYVHVGRRLFGDFGGQWARFDLFAAMEQNLTPNKDTVSGRRDRFNPASIIGASFTLGGPIPR